MHRNPFHSDDDLPQRETLFNRIVSCVTFGVLSVITGLPALAFRIVLVNEFLENRAHWYFWILPGDLLLWIAVWCGLSAYFSMAKNGGSQRLKEFQSKLRIVMFIVVLGPMGLMMIYTMLARIYSAIVDGQ